MKSNHKNTPPLMVALWVWMKIGCMSFGGPAAQIALMHRELVQQRQWLSEQQFLSGLSFCMLLPGPEAMQLATYSGWRLFGIRGGLVAGALFVIPGALVVMLLAYVYMRFGEVPAVTSVFTGIKAAVLVIVIEALIRLYRRMSVTFESLIITLLAFVGIFFLQLSFPLIVIAFGIYGYLRTAGAPVTALQPDTGLATRITTITVIGLLCWWVPIGYAWFAGHELLAHVAVFFSKLAVVTFGGAYAVLAYMAQDVVIQFQWLSNGEMMDALGLAETTPGPLILVTQFVAYVAGYHQGGVGLAFAAAAMALWVTFVPCFVWIFIGAPFIEWVSEHPRLKGALDAVTAAVVGVMINLSLWFALHVLFGEVTAVEHGPVTLWTPTLLSFNGVVAAMTLLASVLLLVKHWHVLWVLITLGVAGWLSDVLSVWLAGI